MINLCIMKLPVIRNQHVIKSKLSKTSTNYTPYLWLLKSFLFNSLVSQQKLKRSPQLIVFPERYRDIEKELLKTQTQ